MNLAILPLAITVLAGPQIMSAIIFVTSTRPVRTSAAFITGVAFAATIGVLITINVASLLDNNLSLGDSADKGSTGYVVQYLLVLLVALLVALAVKNYVRRETVEPPRWLGTLQRADAKRAFSVGFW